MSTITSEMSEQSDEMHSGEESMSVTTEMGEDAEEEEEQGLPGELGTEDEATPTRTSFCSCGAEERSANYFFKDSECNEMFLC